MVSCSKHQLAIADRVSNSDFASGPVSENLICCPARAGGDQQIKSAF
jgi:hypothetical protein